MSARRVRLYEIYPAAGGFSAKTVDYRGEIVKVAAVSIRQAYALAARRDGLEGPDQPVGIVEHYTKNGPPDGWHRLWDGCRIHGGIGLKHGASRTAITQAMQRHRAQHEESS